MLRDGRVMAYGSMGGDAQPQVQAGVFSRHVLHRRPLDQAIEGPRWLCRQDLGQPIGNLMVEARLDGSLIERLMAAGHDVVLDRRDGPCWRGGAASGSAAWKAGMIRARMAERRGCDA